MGRFACGDLDVVSSEAATCSSRRPPILMEDIDLLVGDREKYLVVYQPQYYHFLVNTLTSIQRVLKSNPATVFVIILPDEQVLKQLGMGAPSIVQHLMNALRAANVDFVVLNAVVIGDDGTIRTPIYKISNFNWLLDSDHEMLEKYEPGAMDVVEAVTNLLKPIGLVDSYEKKKIYLSRAKVGNHQGYRVEDGVEWDGYRDDIRIYNESLVEDYMRSIGYEVVYSEDFSSFKDQVEYMSKVGVVVSPTGTGLINIAFMDPGSTVVELKVELLFNSENEGLHQRFIYDYESIAIAAGHEYISLPIAGKSGAVAVEKLKEISLRLQSLGQADPTRIFL